jgi:hypothetical protein
MNAPLKAARCADSVSAKVPSTSKIRARNMLIGSQNDGNSSDMALLRPIHKQEWIYFIRHYT